MCGFLVRNLALLAVLLAILAALLALGPAPARSQSGQAPITGYAWSDTIGWIDLNCQNQSGLNCTAWGLSIDPAGAISGYAWSDNIGWVSANASDLSGCPSAPCAAALAGNHLQGWLKALGGGSAQSGGWDGWISLNGSNYGPTLQNGTFSGFAWGSDVVGWVDFSQAGTAFSLCPAIYSCQGSNLCRCDPSNGRLTCNACPYGCTQTQSGASCNLPPQPTGSFTVTPTVVAVSGTVTVAWNISNADSCAITSTNNGGSWSGLSGTETSNPIESRTVYTLYCTDGQGPDQTSLTENITVNVAPGFQER